MDEMGFALVLIGVILLLLGYVLVGLILVLVGIGLFFVPGVPYGYGSYRRRPPP